ncbi:zinc-dependent alcohol dehydrogenase family protein [Streptomyces sp. DSM 44917]|uniref:Zinc-dependent alcohol dehydrogenase family protein n=1 Tax=Streptomyces boetiae TaxID=3075541 RepID=A0ABU2L760_9ACTN|nr:zinc-dependent alcohol dehydrogenase family protein [Streptomyces sp. DSM 44917]MDT0307413.1 zinc-dependent alcohol dehydrogenase family protein [Streptomyces sp. DSM 44917]
MTTAIRFHAYGGPDVLTLQDVEIAPPGPGELRLRVDAIGLNRAESLFRSGTYGEPVRRFPTGLGYEAAGEVEAVGPDVTEFAPGDAVSVLPAFSMTDYHTYAASAIVPARAVVHRPADVDAVTGAAVWMAYLTAHGGLVSTGGLRAGDTVLLTAAASSVGLAAIQVARRVGAVPIATTRSAAKREALLRAGAAEVIVTGGNALLPTADVVFDPVLGPGLADLAAAVRPGGVLVAYGALAGPTIEVPALPLLRSGVQLRGYSVRRTFADPEELRRAVAFVNAGLATGEFRPVVDRVFDGLGRMPEAHRYLESNAQIGKIVVTVRHPSVPRPSN